MKVFNWFRRLFRRQQQQVNYALLYPEAPAPNGLVGDRWSLTDEILEGELNKLRREAAIGQLKRFA